MRVKGGKTTASLRQITGSAETIVAPRRSSGRPRTTPSFQWNAAKKLLLRGRPRQTTASLRQISGGAKTIMTPHYFSGNQRRTASSAWNTAKRLLLGGPATEANAANKGPSRRADRVRVRSQEKKKKERSGAKSNRIALKHAKKFEHLARVAFANSQTDPEVRPGAKARESLSRSSCQHS